MATGHLLAAYFSKEVNTGLAKPPLNFSCGLAKLVLDKRKRN